MNSAVKTLLLFASLSAPAWAEDCSKLLSSHERVTISVKDLAKLRVDLDLQNAMGSQNFVNQLLETNYQLKKSELALLEPKLEQKLKKEVARIEKDRQATGANTKRIREEQEKRVHESITRSEIVGKIASPVTSPGIEVLADGKIVFLNGSGEGYAEINLYDPKAKQGSPRILLEKKFNYFGHSRLADDTILISGGELDGTFNGGGTTLASVRKFDPKTGTITEVGQLKNPRYFHEQVTLLDGRVLFIGGMAKVNKTNTHVTEIEVYDPADDSIKVFMTPTIHLAGNSVLLPNGNILMQGERRMQLIDVANQETIEIGELENARTGYSYSLLPDGRYVAIAGWDPYKGRAISKIEIVDPIAKTIVTSKAKLGRVRSGHQQITLDDGRILIVGGQAYKGEDSVEILTMSIYDPVKDKVTLVDMPPRLHRKYHRLVKMPDGSVLVLGGIDVSDDGDGSHILDVEQIWVGK